MGAWEGGYDVMHDLDKVIAEAQEARVVRCKECVYFRPWKHDRGDDSRCEYRNVEMSAEDYCSKALYKEEER